MFDVIYKKRALKAVPKMPKNIADEFFSAFDQLARNNEEGLDVKKLSGRPGYRLRTGGYRAITTIDGVQLIILNLDVGPRRSVYK